MRSFHEFKGYRTRVEYDVDAKGFVYRKVAGPSLDSEEIIQTNSKRELPAPTNETPARSMRLKARV